MLSRYGNLIAAEFARHLPYTMVGSLVSMAAVWWFGSQYLADGNSQLLFDHARGSFHLIHPLHVSLSAIATTSLYWRYERHVLRAMSVGAWATIVPCGLSDYIFPYIGGRLLGYPMALHICIIKEPQLFFSFLALGILGGFWAGSRLRGSHLFSHGAHVFVSSGAALLYMLSFGFTSWMLDVQDVFPVFATIVLAVWVPCCISNILIPVATAHKGHVHAA